MTGLSLFDLLNEMRIGKTANYLLYTDLTLEEIAAALGLDKKQVDNRLYQTKRRLRASVTGAEGE